MSTLTVIVTLMIGLAAGILSGLVGIGGGLIMVPALVLFLGLSQKQAQGTSLGLLFLPVGLPAVISYYDKGLIDWKVTGIMSLCFLAGAGLGSKWALKVPEKTVKKIFAFILLYAAVQLLRKGS